MPPGEMQGLHAYWFAPALRDRLSQQPLTVSPQSSRTGLRLQAVDPHRVLRRGYAWLSDTEGHAITSAQGLLVGQPGLRVLFLIDSPAQLALIEASRPSAPLEVLLELGPGPELALIDLDLDSVAQARKALPVLGNSRFSSSLDR